MLEKTLVIAVVIILPHLALVTAFALLIHRSLRTKKKIPLYAAVTSAALCVAFLTWTVYSTLWTRSSTAAIGFILLPFYLVAIAALGYAAAWSLLTLSTVTERARRCLATKPPGRWKTMIALLLLLAIAFAGERHLERRAVLSLARSPGTDAVALLRLTADALRRADTQLLTQLANNPASEASALEDIFDHCIDYTAGELARSCYRALLALAKNQRTPAHVLTTLAQRSETSVRVAVARHANTPASTIVALSGDREELVRTWVTQHSALPDSVLRNLSEDDSEVVRLYARAAVKQRASESHPAANLAN